MAGVEVLRRIAEEGTPAVTVRLVNWADEEGARFGRSLFGSRAAAGSMADQDELRQLTRRDGVALPDAVARARRRPRPRARGARSSSRTPPPTSSCTSSRGRCSRRMDLPLGVVLGTFGVERHRITLRGQAAHAGSTPMDQRRDALAGAAKLALEIREIAARDRRRRGLHDGRRRRASRGSSPRSSRPRSSCSTSATSTPAKLAAMLASAQAASRALRAGGERSRSSGSGSGTIEPILFDEALIELARRGGPRGRAARRTACRAARCTTRPRSRAPACRR